MRLNHYFFYPAIALAGLISCKKQNSKPNNGPDIYVAGTISYPYNNPASIAVYCKNNIAHKLTGQSAGAIDMLLNDTDLYVAGYSLQPSNSMISAIYWKNGVPFTMGANDGATAIALNGNNLYVAFTGASVHGFDQPYYWQNGTFNPLTDGAAEAFTKGMLVNGSDIYVTGASANNYGDDDNIEATYWKNGVITKLVNSTYASSMANAITIQGTDVYVAGYVYAADGYEVVYWKNGTMVKLAANSEGGNAFAIAVQDTNVYVAGYLNQKATYWKNGIQTSLSNGSINSIAISGSDVYFAGNDNLHACYWKNGTEVQMTSLNGNSIYSTLNKIIVVPH
jgi:hypothetical protein